MDVRVPFLSFPAADSSVSPAKIKGGGGAALALTASTIFIGDADDDDLSRLGSFLCSGKQGHNATIYPKGAMYRDGRKSGT